MHNNKITVAELAEKMDINSKYVSSILNGKKTPKGARERFEKAVDEIIKERVG
jgi:transcriptional regulator with XRE-family HTH domain